MTPPGVESDGDIHLLYTRFSKPQNGQDGHYELLIPVNDYDSYSKEPTPLSAAKNVIWVDSELILLRDRHSPAVVDQPIRSSSAPASLKSLQPLSVVATINNKTPVHEQHRVITKTLDNFAKRNKMHCRKQVAVTRAIRTAKFYRNMQKVRRCCGENGARVRKGMTPVCNSDSFSDSNCYYHLVRFYDKSYELRRQLLLDEAILAKATGRNTKVHLSL